MTFKSALPGEIAEEKTEWVRGQLETIDKTGTTESVQVMDRPIVVYTIRGRKSGLLRRVPLMRVEHDGSYGVVASKGGAPEHPAWYHNLQANPEVEVQDGTTQLIGIARELSGPEREQWWDRAVAAYPEYANYQTKTDRQIPVFVVEPVRTVG
ncbi:deazaflavin-dependent oxidoreductase (nitroreductase family) [Branchiibius hedensis]|uniref:Deazaflavin-dependent oxidoreductase, nitroreductase family n=1 Tax=Branchiibius hedensis TaxID=672460 RepID=A0A2Y8ZR12_9MICO|nr:nitroreductase family deazaflavin-dependent oxidoreductase [Branchiibius hedensis]PWJ24962.1 deazaflavin-dependent oxidoreductase (nitroreductase family) [Branchiibius hedensis]SSA33778.1 deazaflavin-dependent oxidoreductase, nitroreductase family [Branchiibius hedensis]